MGRHPGFCPSCFAKLDAEADACPECGARMEGLSARDYRDKLLCALHHPLAEVRMRAIIALGLRAEPETAEALVACAFRHPTDVTAGLEIIARLRTWPEGPLRDGALRALSRHPSRLVVKAAERSLRLKRRSSAPA